MGNQHHHSTSKAVTYDAIFFSPHLDDAILSAGNAIAVRTKAGKKVLIISIFTTATDFPSQDAADFTKRCGFITARSFFQARRKEDLIAAKMVGAETLHLDFTDAGFRADHAGFTSVFSPHLTSGDKHLFELVTGELQKVVSIHAKTNTELFFPVGIGLHVDHQIVTLAAGKITNPTTTQHLYFWEDIPYRNLTGATITRIAGVKRLLKGMQFVQTQAGSKAAAQKQQAIAAYKSQLESLLSTGGYAPSYDTVIEGFWHA